MSSLDKATVELAGLREGMAVAVQQYNVFADAFSEVGGLGRSRQVAGEEGGDMT